MDFLKNNFIFSNKKTHLDSEIKNYILDDPLLDWLNMYGENKNIKKEIFKESEFENFLKNQCFKFKRRIITELSSNFNVSLIPNNIDIERKINITINEIKLGTPIIINGSLFIKSYNIYCDPTLIVRSDYIKKIFNNSENCKYYNQFKGCKFNKKWHYVIFDINYQNIHLSKKNNQEIISNSKNLKYIKSKLYLQNLALSDIQNFNTEATFLIGKRYINDNNIINSCFGFLSVINYKNEEKLINKTKKAILWLDNLKKNGNKWNIKNNNLFPNMCNNSSNNWKNTKNNIAQINKEITLIWGCGTKQRKRALEEDIFTWNNNNCSADKLGIKGKKQKIVDSILLINRCENNNILISPRKIKNFNNLSYIKKKKIEFFVDFEMVNDLNDDFTDLTKIVDSKVLFMIGCYTCCNNDIIEYKNFTVEQLDKNQEIMNMKKWLKYMNDLSIKYNCNNYNIYHWSKAEVVQYNNVKKYHKNHELPNLNFVDILDVFKKEPITIKGIFNYGLKNVAEKMYEYKMINTIWDDKNIDGKEAMIYAWGCQQVSKKKNKNISKMPLMKEIIKYNYYDCKVLQEIINYLRLKMT